MSLNTTAVRLKVTLNDVKPEVMRRLVLPLTLRLDRLHLTLQAAFGWTNSHLFEFHAGEERWGIPDPDGDSGPQPIDARKARLYDIVRRPAPRRSITSMTSAMIGSMSSNSRNGSTIPTPTDMPFLLEAAGRYPPEDVGGADGYAAFLAAIADPAHSAHVDALQWAPTGFDPTVVDQADLQRQVDALAQKWWPRSRK